MKVIILATGKAEEHNDSYGARLIEQGKAVPAPPVAEEANAVFPQRSKNQRDSERPNDFSGAARREAAPPAKPSVKRNAERKE